GSRRGPYPSGRTSAAPPPVVPTSPAGPAPPARTPMRRAGVPARETRAAARTVSRRAARPVRAPAARFPLPAIHWPSGTPFLEPSASAGDRRTPTASAPRPALAAAAARGAARRGAGGRRRDVGGGTRLCHRGGWRGLAVSRLA